MPQLPSLLPAPLRHLPPRRPRAGSSPLPSAALSGALSRSVISAQTLPTHGSSSRRGALNVAARCAAMLKHQTHKIMCFNYGAAAVLFDEERRGAVRTRLLWRGFGVTPRRLATSARTSHLAQLNDWRCSAPTLRQSAKPIGARLTPASASPVAYPRFQAAGKLPNGPGSLWQE